MRRITAISLEQNQEFVKLLGWQIYIAGHFIDLVVKLDFLLLFENDWFNIGKRFKSKRALHRLVHNHYISTTSGVDSSQCYNQMHESWYTKHL